MKAQRKSGGISRDVISTSLQMVLGLIAGVLLCAFWLILKPVEVMDGPPSASRTIKDRHEVLFVRGRAAARGAQGARKQKAFLDRTPGELVVVEEDVNRWLAGAYASKERNLAIESLDLTFGPRVPMARFVGDEMEIGVEIGMDKEGGTRTLVAQARGHFVTQDGRQVFVPRKIYLGSCPLPWNLGGRLVYHQLMKLYPIAGNVEGAWSAVSRAEIVDSRLRLAIGNVSVSSAPESAPAAVPAAVPATVPAAGAPTAAAPAAVAPMEVTPEATVPASDASSTAAATTATVEPAADASAVTETAPAPATTSLPEPAPAMEAPAPVPSDAPAATTEPASEPATETPSP